MGSELYTINGKERCLREVLQNKYVIEYFQRDYTWERRHIEQLLYDLQYQFFLSYKDGHDIDDVQSYRPYFMGPYIINKENSAYSLVDGQQRLTSFTLIVIYLMKECPILKEDLLNLVRKRYFGRLNYNIQVDERKPVMDHLLEGIDIEENELTTTNLNIIERYNDIEELFLEELKSEKMMILFANWLIEKIIFVEILSYSKENAYTIFETMNDRGKHLTSTEMLKGFVLSLIKDETVRQRCNECWLQNMSKLLAFDKDADCDFFRVWFRARFAKGQNEGKDFEQIGTAFHQWMKTNLKQFSLKTDLDILYFIEDEMTFYVQVYLKIRKAEIHPEEDLFTIFSMTPCLLATSLFYPLYLSAVNISDTAEEVNRKLQSVANGIDRFIALRILGQQSINQSSIKYIMYGVIEEIRGSDFNCIQKSMDSLIVKYANKEWTNTPISGYQYKYLKYIHYRINLYLIRLISKSTSIDFKEFSKGGIAFIDGDGILNSRTYKTEGKKIKLVESSYFNPQKEESQINMYYNFVNKEVFFNQFSSIFDIDNVVKNCDKVKRARSLFLSIVKHMWSNNNL